MQVECTVEYVDLEGDYEDVEGVRVTCTKCGHTTESFGTSSRSIRRCLALMNEECSCNEDNFYVAPGA